MAALALRTDETAALVGAGLLHVALIAVLLMQPEERMPPPPPERVVVNLSEEVGMTSTSPDPVLESRASQAPTLSDSPAPPPPDAMPEPLPRPITAPPVQTRARTQPPTRPTPVRTSTPRPTPTRASRPAPAPSRSSAPRPRPSTAPARSGASRIGSDFLPGAGTSTSSTETRIPASQIGGSAKASLLAAITRKLRPHWDAPNGVDAELLVTPVSWRLAENGSLQGSPSCGTTRGVTDSNRPQSQRHCELAIRAVRLAAPFDLPDEYYNAWKSVRNFEFSGEL